MPYNILDGRDCGTELQQPCEGLLSERSDAGIKVGNQEDAHQYGFSDQ